MDRSLPAIEISSRPVGGFDQVPVSSRCFLGKVNPSSYVSEVPSVYSPVKTGAG